MDNTIDTLAWARQLHENGRLQQAIAHFTASIEQAGAPDAYLFLLRAVAFHDAGQFQAALADANQAVALGPYVDTAYWVRGRIFAALGDARWAVSNYSQAIELNPGEAAYFEDRALAWQQAGQPAAAAADLATARRLTQLPSDPTVPESYPPCTTDSL